MTYEFSAKQVAPKIQRLSVPQQLGLVPWPKPTKRTFAKTAWLLVDHHQSSQ